jgi:hypothetical protein
MFIIIVNEELKPRLAHNLMDFDGFLLEDETIMQ